ncbi:helix-turn-helix domain-containing protein (plasmid) [Photobacterium damselae]|uniref:XRE family transcriptional regulator n=1 Tax=Photobacterium damselae TaxID=38293 RepID=UPI002543A59E
MPNKSSMFDSYFLEQGLGSYPERLKLLLSQQTYSQLSKKTGIKSESLSLYKSGRIHPSLPRLAAIAHECDVSLQWLLFGNVEPAQPPKEFKPLKATLETKQLNLTDDAMYPTIALLGGVLYKPIVTHLNKNKIFTEGIYVISVKGNKLARRLQWQHKEECYLVSGDNPKYKPQLVKNLQVLGKVISIITPV